MAINRLRRATTAGPRVPGAKRTRGTSAPSRLGRSPFQIALGAEQPGIFRRGRRKVANEPAAGRLGEIGHQLPLGPGAADAHDIWGPRATGCRTPLCRSVANCRKVRDMRASSARGRARCARRRTRPSGRARHSVARASHALAARVSAVRKALRRGASSAPVQRSSYCGAAVKGRHPSLSRHPFGNRLLETPGNAAPAAGRRQ